MKKIVWFGILLSVFALAIYPQTAAAAELSRADATKLLGLMNYKNIVIAGVVHGIGTNTQGSFSSPNVATIFAYGELNGNPNSIMQTVYYDNEIGWFHFAVQRDGIRLWTPSGYKELKPAPAQ
jgi:hypothetical protein